MGESVKSALERYFCGLNERQRQAVFKVGGPLLILAGAGSGKTTVLVRRIENMVMFGQAYERADPLTPEAQKLLARMEGGEEVDPGELSDALGHGRIKPWNILAITFTNKAAGELRERLDSKLPGGQGAQVNAFTFHSLCARILRVESERLGFSPGFTIYDSDDSQRMMKTCLKAENLDEKIFAPRMVLGEIGRAKDKMLSPDDFYRAAGNDFMKQKTALLYDRYARELKSANAMDFDDLIYQTVRLFDAHPDLRDKYRERYKWVMVDEYQDTSHAQYLLISAIASGHKNLCVVGDDDQSIYKFRGASIENILSFERQFAGADVIRLEENYRSTSNILNAANKVIANNTGRKGKNLWTRSGQGEKIRVERVGDEREESRLIAQNLTQNVAGGAKFSDHAILYRMNAMSMTLEQELAKSGIPYRIIGGTRFYDRKEIKDITAYLSVLNNPGDSLRLSRIINEPKRQIGPTTVASALEIAQTTGQTMFEVLEQCEQFDALAKKKSLLLGFTAMINELGRLARESPLDVLLEHILERTGYRAMLAGQGFEGAGRLENILELKTNLIRYQQTAEEPSLPGFLEEIALYTDLDNFDPNADSLVLMTIHAAKGLEFENVYIAGMDEGVFPGRGALQNPDEMEEERRLAYVAITRAKRQLFITTAKRRLIFGQTMYTNTSRFVEEIPDDCTAFSDHAAAREAVRRASPALPKKQKKDWGASTSIGVGETAGKPAAKTTTDYRPGERVSHKAFGQGSVVSIKPMGGDTLLEINFDSGQTKKIMANFAHLTKK